VKITRFEDVEAWKVIGNKLRNLLRKRRHYRIRKVM